jgi:hypothetical protein
MTDAMRSVRDRFATAPEKPDFIGFAGVSVKLLKTIRFAAFHQWAILC